jgi:hypothetical protein
MMDSIVIRYAFHNGPGKERQEGATLELNCQAWVHYDLRTLGIKLPAWMRSKEIFEDDGLYFHTLGSGEISQRGDVFLFGGQTNQDPRFLHLAVHSGYQMKETAEPILTHATVMEGTVSPWPLSQFFNEPRYVRLFGIKRPIALSQSVCG